MSPVAATILEQMGGHGRISVMTGARNFLYSDDSISWAWPARGKKPNRIVIKLLPDDTYRMTISHYSQRFGLILVDEFDGVYCDRLMDLFEESTGLYLTLRRR